MIIEKTKQVVKKSHDGRPPIYPFHELQPGTHIKLSFSPDDDLKKAALQVSSAISNYKRRNAPNWHTKVRREGFDIYVYRIH